MQVLLVATGWQEEEDAKTLVHDKSDRTIMYVFCRDIHLTLTFTSLYKKIRLKESEVWRKVVSNKIIVTLVCRLLSSPVQLRN